MLKAWGAILRGAAKLQNPIDITDMSMGFLTFIGYLCKMGSYCQQVYRSQYFLFYILYFLFIEQVLPLLQRLLPP